MALAVTSVFALPTLADGFRSRFQPGGTQRDVGSGIVGGQEVALTGLESGACLSFSANAGSSGKTVFIDPGHGGPDPGVVGDAGGRPFLEKDVTLAVGTRLAALLQGDGYRVVMSRTKDSTVMSLSPNDSVSGAMTASAVHRDLVTRAACANAADASVLVSIHFDGFDDPSVSGTESFYDGARPFAAQNKILATDLQDALVAALDTVDRGVWTDDQMVGPALTTSGSLYGHLIVLGPAQAGWVDNPSKMPGALVEPLFLTNVSDARLAAGASGQERIAVALQRGVEKFLNGS